MKRVQSMKSLSLISTKPINLLVFTGYFSFSDMVLKRVNPIFLNIKSDALRFFLYQKRETHLVHHWHKNIFNEQHNNTYSSSMRIHTGIKSLQQNYRSPIYSHQPNHLTKTELLKSSSIQKNNNTFNQEKIYSKISQQLSSINTSSHKLLNEVNYLTKTEFLNSYSKQENNDIFNTFNKEKTYSNLSWLVNINKNPTNQQAHQLNSLNIFNHKVSNQPNHLTKTALLNSSSKQANNNTFNQEKIYSNLSQQLSSINTSSHKVLNKVNDLTSTEFLNSSSKKENNNIFNQDKTYSKLSWLVNISRNHINQQGHPLNSLNISNHKVSNQENNDIFNQQLISKKISLQKNFNLNETSTHPSHSSHSELNYNKSIEIIYKKESIQQKSHTNHLSNNHAELNKSTHTTSPLNQINSSNNYEKDIDTIITNVEKRVVQSLNTDVMAKVEARWSREIIRRGGTDGS